MTPPKPHTDPRRRYCDCGQRATHWGPGGWECDRCKAWNLIAQRLLEPVVGAATPGSGK